jgi:hypothetical protein
MPGSVSKEIFRIVRSPSKPLSREVLKTLGCSKIVRSSHPQKAPRRRSSATPHTGAFEDGGEMAVFSYAETSFSTTA